MVISKRRDIAKVNSPLEEIDSNDEIRCRKVWPFIQLDANVALDGYNGPLLGGYGRMEM